MNLGYVHGLWEEMRLVNGITMRAIEAIPANKLDAKPIPNMRTPKELVTHMYCMLKGVSDGMAKGEIKEWDEEGAMKPIKSADDLLRFARENWSAANKTIQGLKEAQATALVKNPWTESPFPGFACAQIMFDEHLHHRGQLYAYLRALGAEPPFMWDFENSAAEFQPRQPQKA